MTNRLAAFVVGRRCIATAVFDGLKISFSEVRSFQAKAEKAVSAVTAFINYIIERCEIDAAGLEETTDDSKTRTAELTRLSERQLREHNIPLSIVPEDALSSSYSHPPIYSRAVLRDIAMQIFPQLRHLSSSKELLDAAALGLYVQTERLLSDY